MITPLIYGDIWIMDQIFTHSLCRKLGLSTRLSSTAGDETSSCLVPEAKGLKSLRTSEYKY